jgi:hypothetical protein
MHPTLQSAPDDRCQGSRRLFSFVAGPAMGTLLPLQPPIDSKGSHDTGRAEWRGASWFMKWDRLS